MITLKGIALSLRNRCYAGLCLLIFELQISRKQDKLTLLWRTHSRQFLNGPMIRNIS